jgi:hypothetical protein
MIRKSVFWGLTVVLVAVLVSLIVRSRHLETKSAPKTTEIVKTAQSSPIRILAPQDLYVVGSKTKFVKLLAESAPIVDAQAAAELEVTVENRGSAPYAGVQLRLTYVDNKNKTLGFRDYLVEKPLLPGQTTSTGIIRLDDVPQNALKCDVSIFAADFEPQD